MTTNDAESARPQLSVKPVIALSGICVAFAILNSLAINRSPEANSELWLVLTYGLFGTEPFAFGLWTALGSGSIFKRLPIAVPCLFLVLIVPGYTFGAFADIRKFEFIPLVLMSFGVYTTATLLFLLFRWFTRFRLQTQTRDPHSSIKFSIKELLLLTTLYAVTLGLAAQFQFEKTSSDDLVALDPKDYFEIALLGSTVLAAILLPTTAISLAILHGRPTRFATIFAVALWAVVTVTTCFFVLETMDDLPDLWPLPAVQLVAASLSAILAICLRFTGLRLVRPPRSEPVNSTIVLPSP